MNWLNRIVVHCDCNRPTVNTLRAGGFEISAIEHSALPKSPPFVRPMVIGTAVGAERRYPNSTDERGVVSTDSRNTSGRS
jgi:hypothetical protein